MAFMAWGCMTEPGLMWLSQDSRGMLSQGFSMFGSSLRPLPGSVRPEAESGGRSGREAAEGLFRF